MYNSCEIELIPETTISRRNASYILLPIAGTNHHKLGGLKQLPLYLLKILLVRSLGGAQLGGSWFSSEMISCDYSEVEDCLGAGWSRGSLLAWLLSVPIALYFQLAL